jgi:DNA-binding NtrC family response regulator
MRNMTILTITSRSEWLVDMRPVLHAMGQRRLIVAESMEEAGRLLEFVEPQLIVVHGDGEEFSYEQLDLLLWANSVRPRPAPVLVMVNGYSAEQATVLFQMGVDEYLCEAEHGDRLGSIVNTMIAWASAGRVKQEIRHEAAAAASGKPAFRIPVASSLA